MEERRELQESVWSRSVGSPGQPVGAWVLDRLLGRGTFGEVWQGRHHLFKTDLVAVKLATDPRYAKFLREESTITFSLDHENIVKVRDADPWYDPPYFVMELVEGGSLRSRIAQGGLPLDQCIAFARQILAAIQHAHSKGVIHYDIKPGNILVGSDGRVRLADFGMGKAESEMARSSVVQSGSGEADRHLLRGTLPYMPDEQLQGQPVDHRCDLYAFGRVWFEMLVGRLPYGRDETPRSLRADLPALCDEVYIKATASLSQRARSADELLRLLDDPLSEVRERAYCKPRHEPFYFSNGERAYSASELLELCRKFPARAKDHLYSGHFEPWLRYMYEDALAKRAERCRAYPMRDAGLEEFLTGTCPFIFRNGATATTISDVLSIMKTHPSEAKHALYSGELSSWLDHVKLNEWFQRADLVRRHVADHDEGIHCFLVDEHFKTLYGEVARKAAETAAEHARRREKVLEAVLWIAGMFSWLVLGRTGKGWALVGLGILAVLSIRSLWRNN